MPHLQPRSTALGVAEAIADHRAQRDLSRHELAYLVSLSGYEIDAQRVTAIESGELAASVDDLVAIAYVLEVPPLKLLSHVHSDHPTGEAPAATGLPMDVEQTELVEWMTGKTALDIETRAHWHEAKAADVHIRATFLDDQLAAARQEMEDLGVLALREANAPQVMALRDRIEKFDKMAHEADIALIHADRRADDMAYRLRLGNEPVAENDGPVHIDDDLPFD